MFFPCWQGRIQDIAYYILNVSHQLLDGVVSTHKIRWECACWNQRQEKREGEGLHLRVNVCQCQPMELREVVSQDQLLSAPQRNEKIEEGES